MKLKYSVTRVRPEVHATPSTRSGALHESQVHPECLSPSPQLPRCCWRASPRRRPDATTSQRSVPRLYTPSPPPLPSASARPASSRPRRWSRAATGGGFKLFCSGVGVQYPDISNASRAIKQSEMDACTKAGVKDIIEVKIGYDGIVLANSVKGPKYKLTRRDIFLALAKNVPDPASPQTLIANPNKTWKGREPLAAGRQDRSAGPAAHPPGRVTPSPSWCWRAAAPPFAWIKSLKDVDEARFKKVCDSIREDGAYVEAGENDNLIVQKIEANPKAFGVFRLQLPGRERHADPGRVDRRRAAHLRQHRLQQVSGVAPAVRLCEEGAPSASSPASGNLSLNTPATARWAARVIWPTRV